MAFQTQSLILVSKKSKPKQLLTLQAHNVNRLSL